MENITSLKCKDGVIRTVGILTPGSYDFGVLECDERIMPIDGDFIVNGNKIRRGNRTRIRKGTQLTIVVTNGFICFMRKTIKN